MRFWTIDVAQRVRLAKWLIAALAVGCMAGGGWLVFHPPSPAAQQFIAIISLAATWSVAIGYLAAFLPASWAVRKYAAVLLSLPPSLVTFAMFLWHTGLWQKRGWDYTGLLLFGIVALGSFLSPWPLKVRHLEYRQIRKLRVAVAYRPGVIPLPEQLQNDDTIELSPRDVKKLARMLELSNTPNGSPSALSQMRLKRKA